MAASLTRWLESYEFGTQLLILSLILDPIGAILGYLAHPLLGVDMIYGIALGLVAVSQIHVLWIVRHTRKDPDSDVQRA